MNRERVVLLSGFGPFAEVRDNPSEVVVAAMAGKSVQEWVCQSVVLDVSYRRAPIQLFQAVKQVSPDCVLLLGVARNETTLRVERSAVNCMGSLLEDVDGMSGFGHPIDATQSPQTSLQTSWPVEATVAFLNRKQVPARLSTDAGAYVCNALYYSALQRLEVPVVFLHVPMIGTVWSRDRLVSAVSTLVGALDRLV
jgi:pyroglutamyl-peptidase